MSEYSALVTNKSSDADTELAAVSLTLVPQAPFGGESRSSGRIGEPTLSGAEEHRPHAERECTFSHDPPKDRCR